MIIEEFEEENLQSETDVLKLFLNGSVPPSMLAPLIENIDNADLEELLVEVEGEEEGCFNDNAPADIRNDNKGSDEKEEDENKILLHELRNLAEIVWYGKKMAQNNRNISTAEGFLYQGLYRRERSSFLFCSL